MRDSVEEIKNEIAEINELKKYNSIKTTSPINEIIEQPLLPEPTKSIETEDIKSTNHNSQDLPYQKPVKEIDIKTDEISQSSVIKKTTDNFTENKIVGTVSEEAEEDTPCF